MKSLNLLITAVLLASTIASSQNALAISAGDLKNIKVIGHHFTTYFTNGKRYASVKDVSKARYLVVKLAVEVPSEESVIYLDDFVLQYFHQNGKEDRAKSSAICRAKTIKLGEDDGCAMGTAAGIKLDESTKYISLAFFLENDVTSINIARTGATPITYQVGSDRPFSVFITTNQGSEALSKAEKTIRAGGYQITRTSTGLSEKEKEFVIQYAKGAEVQAREISQRIMTEMGVAPVVKKAKLVSDVDIVVWLGG